MDATDNDLLRLRAQLRATREERMRTQRSLSQGLGVDAAIATVDRQIDSRSSTPVVQSREVLAGLVERLADSWATIDWYRLILARVEAHGFAIDSLPHSSQLIAELAAEATTREELAARFAANEILLRVPPAIAASQPQHPERDELAQRQREIFADASRRLATKTRQGTRRPKDQHGAR